MSEIFILLATFDDPEIPTEIWPFGCRAEAESFLRGWSADFLGGLTHAVNDLPPDAALVTAFRAAGAHVRLFKCELDGGGGDELTPFEYAAEPA
jgi:hypothetical protein